VALVGRPNVGKSTLFNQMIGEERSVVSNVAGTTRDAIDTDWTSEDGTQFRFIDTAGVRRPGKIGKEMEYWMVVRTRQAIERADVCVLLLDALDGVTHQDLALAGQIVEAGKALVIGVNKFDLAREKSRTVEETDERELEAVPMWDKDIADIRNRYLGYLHNKITFLPWAPVLFFSAKNGKGTADVIASLIAVNAERNKRVPTRELNLLAKDIYYGHVTPSHGLKQGKIKYVSQVDTAPPKFLFFVNNIQAFHFSYKRYIENKIREKYGFAGTPIIVELKDAMASWRGRSKDGKNASYDPSDKDDGEE
jgi:GTP-binding protein